MIITLDTVLARLEAATEPSRGLDALIWLWAILPRDGVGLDGDSLAPGYHFAYHLHTDGTVDILANNGGDPPSLVGMRRESPLFTASIDQAATLLPEWMSYELTGSAAGPPTFTRARLWDWRRGPLMSDPGNEWKSEGNRPLPINLCIAALNARPLAAAAAPPPPRVIRSQSDAHARRAEKSRPQIGLCFAGYGGGNRAVS